MARRKKRDGVRSWYSHSAFLKRLRDVCGDCSFDELELMTGINRETMRRQVRGENRPTAEQAARVCETFRVSADWLLFGRGPRRR